MPMKAKYIALVNAGCDYTRDTHSLNKICSLLHYPMLIRG